nr:MAG TPA: tail protein [Caudoviricetes sp.]
MAISKVIYGSTTLIDLTADTVAASKLLTGYTAHGANGEAITGTCNFDANTSDANATASEILAGQTAYVNAQKITGTMPNNGGVTGIISTKAQEYSIPQGYHDGSGTVSISSTEQDKIIAGNIKQGVSILGVTGTLEPSSEVTAQEKSVTPSTEEQVVLPDPTYDYLSQVTVAAIPYAETSNSAGGMTVTIG